MLKVSRTKSILRHPLIWFLLAPLATAVIFLRLARMLELWPTIEAYLRLEPAKITQNSIFNLSDYLATLALFFVIITVSDFRHRFRLLVTAPPCIPIAFTISFGIGFLILIIDFWFSNNWLTPAAMNNSNNIKVVLALLFLGMTCYLSLIAFVSPPTFSKRNAHRAFNIMHHYVARGNPEQLVVIADWLAASADQIVEFSARHRSESSLRSTEVAPSYLEYADYTLLLLGNKKICQEMVDKSPWTVAELFRAAAQYPYAKLPISQFSRNIGTELIINSKPALYVEDDGHTSGLLGYTKPITTSVFGNFHLVEQLASSSRGPLDIEFPASYEITAAQLTAYARAVLIFSRSYVAQPYPHHSYAFFRSLSVFESQIFSISGLGTLGDQYWRSDDYAKLKASIRFIRDIIKILSEKPTPAKRREKDYPLDGLAFIHHQVANLIFSIVKSASRVRAAPDICWGIQHNCIWSDLFTWDESKSKDLIAFYLRRLMYDEIKRVEEYPNFVGAGIIGYCLNVLGVHEENKEPRKKPRFAPVQRTAASWVKRNYLRLHEEYPAVADAILVGGLSFDPQTKRIIKTYASILGKPGHQEYLQLIG